MRTVSSLFGSTLIFALLLVSIDATTPASAEFNVEPYIQGGARFDTNPRYQSSRQEFDSAWGTIVDARLPLEYRTQRLSITLDPRIRYSFYPDSDDDDLEDRDNYLTGTANWLSPQSNIGASYGYTDLSLRTSEFQDAGGTPGGSGRIFSTYKQQRWYFQPYWQYQFSPANVFTLNGGYEEVRYDEDRVSRRFDYDYSTVTAALQHALSERHKLSLQAQFTKFDSENTELRISNESESNSLSLIYTYSWSERSEVSADIGWARTKNTIERPNDFDPVSGPFCNPVFIPIFPCETKSDSTNFVGNLTATHQSETVEYTVVLGQSITPNSNGAEVLRFNINARAKKRFTKRFTGWLGIVAFTQDNLGDDPRFEFGRDYIRGNLRLNYRFARRWSVYGAYSYTFSTENRFLTEDRTIRNHFASMGITFKSDGWRW